MLYNVIRVNSTVIMHEEELSILEDFTRDDQPGPCEEKKRAARNPGATQSVETTYDMAQLREDINSIKLVLGEIVSMKNQIQELTDSVQFIPEKYEDQRKITEKLEKKH